MVVIPHFRTNIKLGLAIFFSKYKQFILEHFIFMTIKASHVETRTIISREVQQQKALILFYFIKRNYHTVRVLNCFFPYCVSLYLNDDKSKKNLLEQINVIPKIL